MQVPPAGIIEEALDCYEATDPHVPREIKELRATQAENKFLVHDSEDFACGYVFGLHVARTMLKQNPQAVIAGLTDAL